MKMRKTLVLLITSAMLLQNTLVFAGTNLDKDKIANMGSQFKNEVIINDSIELNKTSDTLNVGETESLVPRIQSSEKLVVWQSSDESIATVNQKGKITGVGLGSTTITALSLADLNTATCTITVKDDITDIVKFKDKNLEQVVRHAINKPEGILYKSDVENITSLEPNMIKKYIRRGKGLIANGEYIIADKNEASGEYVIGSITQLNGIENLTNLSWLSLGGNEIRDLGPLKGLKKLKILALSNNCISDISELHGLPNLEAILLGGNEIEDVSPLVGLRNLNSLDLSYNKIKKISRSQIIGICLNEGFPHLNRIVLDHNDINDADKITITGICDCSF
ncbi:leucine-rich repeat protein [Clostridium tagluense]|uniref:leucine-rich repeat protein n=1 Tax=Clostridium tagluense TaxID=360422 RepID=UPI001CF41FBF|nr:leucine-rich repeat protein [Clostridium tagluense]MCB2310938.1 leucine-rich repeat protein [Clostridium tagluense]MCB2315792.1 leucine-rich repeat protein [Clostridium tagluense]MCB2320564.1 leucine-rich repeat protein [Clostridium tagluense]MCB2325531.1 leucine-rich repeat protein [Clostridium tagluense]MCB2330384.1 leucine-rich repeat protein [Clostridium tagluense]